MDRKTLITHLSLWFVTVLYGANYSAVKVLSPSIIGPFGFLVFRVGLSGLLFWLLDIIFNKEEKIAWKADGKRILVCALLGVGINMLLFFKGVSLTSAINASIIMTLTPITAKSDAAQQLNFEEFKEMCSTLQPIAQAIGRKMI